MGKNRLIIALAFFAMAAIGAAGLSLKPRRTDINDPRTTPQPGLRQQAQPKEIWIGDVLSDDDTLGYNGYVVEKRHRKVRYEYPPKIRSRPSWIDVSYAVIKRQGRVLAKFDDNIYFGMGNDTRFGLFSFLGGPTKQLVISQDISRGGTQWVVAFSRRPRVIFDGSRWSVGREGDDVGIIDLDGDGVSEITVPITDFYLLQDKMSLSQIRLPTIVFKYDPQKRRYQPANPVFSGYLIKDAGALDEDVTSNDQFALRAAVVDKLLTYIYVGEEKQAWDFYDRSYKLSDKEEIRRRVKTILNRQPVYKFIYNRSRNA